MTTSVFYNQTGNIDTRLARLEAKIDDALMDGKMELAARLEEQMDVLIEMLRQPENFIGEIQEQVEADSTGELQQTDQYADDVQLAAEALDNYIENGVIYRPGEDLSESGDHSSVYLIRQVLALIPEGSLRPEYTEAVRVLAEAAELSIQALAIDVQYCYQSPDQMAPTEEAAREVATNFIEAMKDFWAGAAEALTLMQQRFGYAPERPLLLQAEIAYAEGRIKIETLIDIILNTSLDI